MQRIARPTLNVLKAPIGQRTYAKANLIGRLGQAPQVRETADGRKYVTYNIAVSRLPQRDANNEIVKDESGYAVRETDWFTIFNFKPSAEASLAHLAPGTNIAVEATLQTRTTGEPPNTQVVLRERSHEVVGFPKKA